jgi:phosphoribosylaminoimidazole-succinocarboxamide synthase
MVWRHVMNNFPHKINLQLNQPYYKGSVQRLFEVPGYPEFLISETTAGGSVFDVGTIFNIEGSDISRASFRHLVFQELQDLEAWHKLSKVLFEKGDIIQKNNSGLVEKMLSEFSKSGAQTHHIGMIDRTSGEVYNRGFPPVLSNLTLIKKYDVIKPDLKKVLKWHFYDYKKYHHKDQYVIPLEYIVRVGVTSGSSILRKYNALSESDKNNYLNELGINKSLSAWMQFDQPIVDLTTKYEPEDRNISHQEASVISGVDGDTFSRSIIMAILGMYLVQQIFAKMGLFLWDLKWEIARDGDELVFVDTIDTDSVRVTVNIVRDNRSYFVHFNKQSMRDYYKIMHPEWYSAVNKAKRIAARSGRAFTEILSDGQKKNEYPPTPIVDERFLDIQKQKFSMIQSFIQNKEKSLQKESEEIAQLEIDYYISSNKKEQYESLNSVLLK